MNVTRRTSLPKLQLSVGVRRFVAICAMTCAASCGVPAYAQQGEGDAAPALAPQSPAPSSSAEADPANIAPVNPAPMAPVLPPIEPATEPEDVLHAAQLVPGSTLVFLLLPNGAAAIKGYLESGLRKVAES